jgi:hypothetical protein
MEAQPLVAQCRSCGGAVPLTLAGPLPQCRYCGSTEPLAPELRNRLTTLRARIDHRTGQQRHLTGKLVSSVTAVQGVGIAIFLTCWLLFGGMALGFSLSHDVPLVDFVLGPPAGSDVVPQWWMLLTLAIGLPLSIALFGLSVFWMRTLAADALPLPPAFPGAPPRCRCCGADLPPGTALRSCQYCGTDNIVAGEKYRRSELNLDRAVGRMASSFDRSLATRAELAGKISLVGSLLPVGLLMVVPVFGLLVDLTVPALWIVPPALALIAVLSWLLASIRKLPAIDPLEALTLEAKLHAGGTEREVNGQLMLAKSDGQPQVFSLIGDRGGEGELMMLVQREGKRVRTEVFRVQAGGPPLAAEELEHLQPGELRRPARVQIEGIRVDSVRALRQKGSLRIWGETASPGDVPLLTAQRMKDAPIIFLP